MEKYIRPTKNQITALALTLVMAGGGAFGVMSAAKSASAQTPAIGTNNSVEISDGDGEYQDDATEPSIQGSIQVTDTDPKDTVKETATSEADEVNQYAGLAKITEADAIKAAEAKVGGTATKATLGNEDGSLVYEVHVGTTEVKVDAGNGTVLATEDEGSEGPEGTEANEGPEGAETDGIDHQFEGEENHID